MRRWMVMAAAAAAVAGLATSAEAQPYGGRGGSPSVTLYEFPGYQGRQVTLQGAVSNLPRQYNDMAQSARFQGRWRICSDSDFRGQCQDVRGDVENLNAMGMGSKISSLQAYFDGGRAGGGPGGGPGGGGWGGGSSGGGWGGGGQGRPMEGARTVLFPYPRMNGYDIAAGGNSANAFCRSNGLNGAAWYDSSERAREALDGDGRYTGETSVLRDVLCRK